MSQNSFNSIQVKHINNIPTRCRWHKAGAFRCQSIHSDIEHNPKRLQPPSKLINSAQELAATLQKQPNMNSKKTTLASPAITSSSNSFINAFDEESTQNLKILQDTDNNAQIKLYKKVYGTMLKNNLVHHDNKLSTKQATEKKPIDAYRAEFEASSNALREIKSTKIHNSLSNSHQGTNQIKLKTFERAEMLPTIITKTSKYFDNTEVFNNGSQKSKISPSCQSNLGTKPTENVQIPAGSRKQETNARIQPKPISSPRIPVPKQLRIHHPRLPLSTSNSLPLTTFGISTAEHTSSPPHTDLGRRLSAVSLQRETISDEFPRHHGDRVHPKLGLSVSRSPSTLQNIEASPPDQPKARARNHVIFICVLLCVITTAVVCVVWFLTQSQGQDEVKNMSLTPAYRVIRIHVTFQLGNKTSSKPEGHATTSHLSLQKMKRMMSVQVDEMFLRSNLSTMYCCNTIHTSRVSPDVKSTITLLDDGVVITSGDVISILESLIVLGDHHGNDRPEMVELSPCPSCIAVEYGTAWRRPKILLYNLKVV